MTNLPMTKQESARYAKSQAKGVAAVAEFNGARAARAAKPSTTAPHGSVRTAGGAGVDYPAHFITSPVDANDDDTVTATREASGAGGAGVAYPAHWKR